MGDTGPRLGGIGILRDLPADALQRLEKSCAWRDYPAGQQIIGHHDESLDVFFLVRGAARVIIYSVTGKPVIFRDIKAGETFGEYSAMDGRPRSATVEALANCTVAKLPPKEFWNMVLGSPPVNEAMTRSLISQVRGLTERVLEFSTLAVKNRLHAELLRLARNSDKADGIAVIANMPTHAELAGRISTHREAVTRELNRLANTGLLKREGSNVVISDYERLENMVEEVLGDVVIDFD